MYSVAADRRDEERRARDAGGDRRHGAGDGRDAAGPGADEVAAGLARWLAQPPSELSDHGQDCCRLARAWFQSLDYSFDSMLASADRFRGPRWIRERHAWGPSRWPLHWCEAVRATHLDCGALAALARDVFTRRGVTCWPVQLIQRFSERDVRQWREQWGSGPGLFGWTAADLIYHEAAAVVGEDGAVRIWDPTHGWWVPPEQGEGYGATLFVRLTVTDPRLATGTMRWGQRRLTPNTWEDLGGRRARDRQRPSRLVGIGNAGRQGTRPVLPRMPGAPTTRPGRALAAWQRLARRHPLAGLGDALLRGASQATFQDHPVTGALLLAVLFHGSWRLGIAALMGLVASTLTALGCRADRGKLGAGVFGFNGMLVGLALASFFRLDAVLAAVIVVGSALTAVAALALDRPARAWNVPPLTAPFVLAVWLALVAAHHSTLLQPVLAPIAGSPGAPLGPADLLGSILRGLGQIVFQDSVVSGAIVLLAIGLSSRLSAAFAALGSLAGALVALILGGDPVAVHHGVYGFNGALCAVVVGGLLFVLTWQTALVALIAAAVSTASMVVAAPWLARLGLPALSGPLTLTVWSTLLLSPAIRALRAVPLAKMTTPEEIRRTLLVLSGREPLDPPHDVRGRRASR